jgi:DNA helicase II / ATP-dependent DNA helicase PcrA
VCLKPEDLRCGIGSLEAKMRISDAVQGFLFTIAGNGYSEATICNYRHSLTRSATSFPMCGPLPTQSPAGNTGYSPLSNQFFEREEIRLMIGALIFLFPQFPEARKWRADAHLGI